MTSFALPGPDQIAVNVHDRDALFAAIADCVARGEGFTVATLNLDHLVKLRRDAAFRDAYLRTRFVVADGRPVVWLSRLAREPVGLAPGSELIEPLCAIAAREGWPVALFGTTGSVLDAAAARLRAACPALRIVFRESPPRGFDPLGAEAAAAAERIDASGATLCFLALGAPKQEIFAVHAQQAAARCGFVSIGAGLDFLAGAQLRAPVWMRRLALEWVWRMLAEPRRLVGRYASCLTILPELAFDALRRRARHAGGAR